MEKTFSIKKGQDWNSVLGSGSVLTDIAEYLDNFFDGDGRIKQDFEIVIKEGI